MSQGTGGTEKPDCHLGGAEFSSCLCRSALAWCQLWGFITRSHAFLIFCMPDLQPYGL